jgi:hypothetical protein
MTTSDIIQICNILATVIAVLAASVLISLRHRPLSMENFEALNSIDVVFADSPKVRDAWTKYFAALNDFNMNNPTGFSIRDEKRRDLFIAIVRHLGLQKKIATTDLLRTYIPTAAIEIDHLEMWERIKRREDLRAEFVERGIGFPDFTPAKYPVQPRSAPQQQRDLGLNSELRPSSNTDIRP